MLVERIPTNAGIAEQRSPGTLRKFMRILGFRESTEQGQAATAAVAGAAPEPTPEKKGFGSVLEVINDSSRVKDLIQVYSSADVEILRDRPAEFYCLDMEAEGLDPVVQWIRRAIHLALQEGRRVPVIYVIGPNRAVTDEEWDRVNEITPWAFFFKRPSYSGSFVDAMQALRDGLVKQYEMRRRMEQRQPKATASEQTRTAAQG
jgi:hypothetical protein